MILPIEIECKQEFRDSVISMQNSISSTEWLADSDEDSDEEDFDAAAAEEILGLASPSTKLPQPMAEPSPHCSYWCPLSKNIMKEPVQTPQKYNFERTVILEQLRENGNVCPLSGKRLTPSDLNPNSKLQWEILYWQRKQGRIENDYSLASMIMPMRRSRVDSTLNSLPKNPSKIDSPPAAPRKRLDTTTTTKEHPKTNPMHLMSPTSRRKTSRPDTPPTPASRKSILSPSNDQQEQQTVDEKVDLPPFAPRRRESRDDLQKAHQEFAKRVSTASGNQLLSFNMAVNAATDSSAFSTSLPPPPPPSGPYDQETVLDILDQVIELGAF